MANIKAKITPQKKLLVTNYKINANSIRLQDVFDVDGSAKSDGSVLVYNGTTNNWEATNAIENPNTDINGGEF